MSKKNPEKSKIVHNKPGEGKKALRRAAALKKAKRKKLLIISGSALVLAAAVVAIVFAVIQQGERRADAEIYAYGSQNVTLYSDGTFTANLFHGAKKSGTYTKSGDTVTFVVNGKQEIGKIENNALHLPDEWDDGHAHASVFPKQQ